MYSATFSFFILQKFCLCKKITNMRYDINLKQKKIWAGGQARASTKRVLNLNFLNYLLIVPMYHGDVSRVIPLQNLES